MMFEEVESVGGQGKSKWTAVLLPMVSSKQIDRSEIRVRLAESVQFAFIVSDLYLVSSVWECETSLG